MTIKNKETVVPANPALVEFPRDQWGMTSELRKAGLRAAQSVRGNEEKHKLFLATLRVLAQHSAARLNRDAEDVALRVQKIAERDVSDRRRVSCAPVAAAPTEPE